MISPLFLANNISQADRQTADLIANLPVPLLLVDERSIVRYVNPAAEELLGFKPGELSAEPLQFPVLEGETSERMINRPDGHPITVKITTAKTFLGEKAFNIVCLQDITNYLQMIAEREEGKARIFRTLEDIIAERTRILLTLSELASLSSEPLEIDEILRQSLHKVLSVIKGKTGFIHLLDEDRQIFRATFQLEPEADATLLSDPGWGTGILHRILQDNTPLIIPDIEGDPVWRNEADFTGFQAYAGMPILSKGKILGILSVLYRQPGELIPEQVTLLLAIVDQMSVGIESARLRRHAEEAAMLEERQRLARELHDSVTQSLYCLSLLAKGWQRGVDRASPNDMKYWLDRLAGISNQALKEMRLLLYDVRPSMLEQDGLVGALKRRLEAVEGRVDTETSIEIDKGISIPPAIETELYRIAQEALNNTLKHAQATRVCVYLRKKPKHIELEIADNGTGFEQQAVIDKGGMGIQTMRERAERINSPLVIHSKPGKGTRVKVCVRISDIQQT